jgi:hypothetical protein
LDFGFERFAVAGGGFEFPASVFEVSFELSDVFGGIDAL